MPCRCFDTDADILEFYLQNALKVAPSYCFAQLSKTLRDHIQRLRLVFPEAEYWSMYRARERRSTRKVLDDVMVSFPTVRGVALVGVQKNDTCASGDLKDFYEAVRGRGQVVFGWMGMRNAGPIATYMMIGRPGMRGVWDL